jgi:hypothetical protein
MSILLGFSLVVYGHYNGYFYFVNMGTIIERCGAYGLKAGSAPLEFFQAKHKVNLTEAETFPQGLILSRSGFKTSDQAQEPRHNSAGFHILIV